MSDKTVHRRGLGAALPPILSLDVPSSSNEVESNEAIELISIVTNPYQPRLEFDESALEELAQSIKIHGILQPVILRPRPESGYWLIAGERRCRAARKAGFTHVPAIIRDISDQQALGIALVENIQREDLNSLEVAHALRRLIDEFNLSHLEAAEWVGRSRATVSNLLRLLDLEAPVQSLLSSGQLAMGHARAIISLPATDQTAAAEQVVSNELTVRQTEGLVRRRRDDAKSPGPNSNPARQSVRDSAPLRGDQTIDTPPEVPEHWQGRVVQLTQAKGTDVTLKCLSDAEWRRLVDWLSTV